MRIAYITPSFPPYMSGLSTNVLQISQGMARRGHDVTVYIPEYPHVPAHECEGGHYTIIKLPSRANPLKASHRVFLPFPWVLYTQLKVSRPDVIHLQDPQFLLFPGVKRYAHMHGVPIVHAHHFPPAFVHEQISPILRPFATPDRVMWAIMQLYTRSDRVVTPTEYMAGMLRTYGLSTPITVISNGVDTGYFTPLRERTSTSDVPMLLFVGRLDPDKHVQTLIQSAIHIKTPCRIVIAGSGRDERSLRTLASHMRTPISITFAGELSLAQCRDLYREATLYVHPGIAEAQSIVSLEAASCGLPLVLARAQALPELIDPTHPNGALFEPDDPQDLARVIDSLLTDRMSLVSMGERSRALALRHTLSLTLDRYEDMYASLVRTYGRDN